MSEIILKLPRRKNKIKIISNPDNIDNLFRKHNTFSPVTEIEDTKSDITPSIVLQDSKTQIIHKFILRDTNEPIQIDLSKIPRPSISIEDARLEVQSGYDHGFSDGQEATIAIYENEINLFKDRIFSIESVIENLRNSFFKEIKKFEEKLIETAIIVSEHILEHEIAIDDNIIIATIKKSLEELQDEKIFQIHINPSDYEILTKLKSKLFTNQSILENVEIIKDTQIDKGGAVLISESGTIDARISSQLNKIKETLQESLLLEDESDYQVDNIETSHSTLEPNNA